MNSHFAVSLSVVEYLNYKGDFLAHFPDFSESMNVKRFVAECMCAHSK